MRGPPPPPKSEIVFSSKMSNRKAVLGLLKNYDSNRILMDRYYVQYDFTQHIKNPKYDDNNFYYCWICKKRTANLIFYTIQINKNLISYNHCVDCINKTLCFTCLRETSHCSIIHTRKLLCWQILLSHKFPKDIIRLITKKVK